MNQESRRGASEMDRRRPRGLLLAIAVLLGGCTAGRNFQVPSEESLILGTTPYSEVLERFGAPYQESVVTKDGNPLRVLTYGYARHSYLGGAHASGVVPLRTLTLTFDQDLLVGTLHRSTFEEDHTDFDETKLPLIQKGVTRRDEVVSLLGPPHGKCVYPLVQGNNEEAVLYSYWQRSRASSFLKEATITLNPDGIVVRVDSRVSGKR